ncbi:hypothetical protein EG834_16320, partial [bacterium]|nr:hypothetical protein [bacterium]
MPRRKKSSKEKQPVAITVIAVTIVLLFMIRLYQVFEPLLRQQIFVNGINGPLIIGFTPTALGFALASSIGYAILSLLGIAVLIGFLRLRRWAWVTLMAWTGVSLVISLVEYFFTDPNYAVMASNVI